MAYVAENELTAEEQQQVVHAIPEDYQNEDTFYLVYKRKRVLRKLVFHQQTGSSDWVASGLGLATATMAVFALFKKTS